MKRLLIGCTAAFMATSLLAGCSIFDKANGIILYGDEQKILDSLKEEHKGQTEKENFSIKIVETDDERIMVMDEDTAQALAGKQLLRKVVDGDDTEAVESLPELEKGGNILYAKKELDEVTIDEEIFKTSYEGNIIIGDGRAYADMFLIVDNKDWPAVAGAEKAIGIIQYNKDPDDIGKFDVERAQLVKITE